MRVRATSLNYRDQAVVAGQYFGGAVSSRPDTDVRWRRRRHRRWIGSHALQARRARRGHVLPARATAEPPSDPHSTACLRSVSSLNEDGLVSIPEHLSYEEAACLPCAAVTAWHALFHAGRPTQGWRHGARAWNWRRVDCGTAVCEGGGRARDRHLVQRRQSRARTRRLARQMS